jgi:2-polyprenyl-3-methyl-5-hydroxy-6-metoxy-1,4-benzoquinol methylase
MLTWEKAVQTIRLTGPQELVEACYYDQDLLTAAERFFRSAEFSAVTSCLPALSGKNILDVGAGRGIAAYAFAKLGANVTALEPDPSSDVGYEAIRLLANHTGLSIAIETSMLENQKLLEQSFDVLYTRAAVHHCINLSRFTQEAYKLLRPGGVFLVTREHVISSQGDLQNFLKNHPLHSLYGGENAYQLKSYLAAFKQTGFRIVKIWGPYDSVINMAPLTPILLSQKICGKLPKLIPRLILLNREEILHPIIFRLLSKLSHSPGRLYSFLLQKE